MRTHLLYLSIILISCGGPMPGGADVPGGKDGQQGTQGAAGRDGKDAVVAGSRLQPLWLVGSDGSKIPAGAFYDTERRERCFLQVVPGAEPGSMERLCAPLNFAASDAARYVRFSVE